MLKRFTIEIEVEIKIDDEIKVKRRQFGSYTELIEWLEKERDNPDG